MYQFQRLQQKEKIVEGYRERMKLLLKREGIKEGPRITMERFQSSLNHEI